MNTEQDYLVTYKFYDSKGRRLSIFARPFFSIGEFGTELPKKPTHLAILIITCSKKDSFSKKWAREAYMDFRTGLPEIAINPVTFLLPIENDKPKYTFLKWCKENYFKKEKVIFAVESEMLMRGDELLNGEMGSFNIHPVFDGDSAPETNEN